MGVSERPNETDLDRVIYIQTPLSAEECGSVTVLARGALTMPPELINMVSTPALRQPTHWHHGVFCTPFTSVTFQGDPTVPYIVQPQDCVTGVISKALRPRPSAARSRFKK